MEGTTPQRTMAHHSPFCYAIARQRLDRLKKFFFRLKVYAPEVVPLARNQDLMMGSQRNREEPSNFVGNNNDFSIFSKAIETFPYGNHDLMMLS